MSQDHDIVSLNLYAGLPMDIPPGEMRLRAHIRHKQAFQALTPDERERMSAFGKKIAAMGLRAGHR